MVYDMVECACANLLISRDWGGVLGAAMDNSERSEVARESFRMASGRIFRVRLNFLSYSLRRLRPRRHVFLGQKLCPPSRWSCKAYKLYRSAGLCLPGKSMFARPKMIAPSWPKVVRPVADGKDVARCGLSIGLLSASRLTT